MILVAKLRRSRRGKVSTYVHSKNAESRNLSPTRHNVNYEYSPFTPCYILAMVRSRHSKSLVYQGCVIAIEILPLVEQLSKTINRKFLHLSLVVFIQWLLVFQLNRCINFFKKSEINYTICTELKKHIYRTLKVNCTIRKSSMNFAIKSIV